MTARIAHRRRRRASQSSSHPPLPSVSSMKRPDRRRRVRPRASRQRSLQKRRRPRGEVRLRQRPSSVRRSLIRLTLRRRRSRRSLPSLRSRARRRHRARLVLVAAFSTTRAEIRSIRSSSPFRAPLSRVSRVFARCKRLSRVVPRVRARASARARDAATRVATQSDARRGPCFFFSSRRRHTRFALVSWARRCV